MWRFWRPLHYLSATSVWVQDQDSNLGPSAYEADELTAAPSCNKMVPESGNAPDTAGWKPAMYRSTPFGRKGNAVAASEHREPQNFVDRMGIAPTPQILQGSVAAIGTCRPEVEHDLGVSPSKDAVLRTAGFNGSLVVHGKG
jgi:hypothetical protein